MTTETKTTAILDAISLDIADHEKRAEAAFSTLEMMNADSEDFKKANWQFCLNNYVATYLRKFKKMIIDNEPLNTIEKRMRFHAYSQRSKGELNDKQEISVAQATVALRLESYIAIYFDAE